MCIYTTNVAFGPKRMLAVTPTNLLRLRPYDLSDARYVVKQFSVKVLGKHFVNFVLKVMRQINYETARSFVQGDTPLYVIHRLQGKEEIQTKKPDFISQQEPYSVQEPYFVYVLLSKKPPKQLRSPVPEDRYYLISGEVYYGSRVVNEQQQLFMRKVTVTQSQKDPHFLVNFDKGIEYKEIDAIGYEVKMK